MFQTDGQQPHSTLKPKQFQVFLNDKRIKLQKKSEQSCLLLCLINLLLRRPDFYPVIGELPKDKKIEN